MTTKTNQTNICNYGIWTLVDRSVALKATRVQSNSVRVDPKWWQVEQVKMEQPNAVKMENSKQLKEKPKAKPPKLKVFEVTQKYFATMDITLRLTDQTYPFSWTIALGFLMLGSAICCTSAFVIYDAETFTDYTQSAYSCSLVAIITFGLLAFVFKVDKLYEVINGYGDLVNISEYISFVTCVLR